MLRIGILVGLLALMCIVVEAAPGRMVYIDGHPMISLRAFSHQFDAVVGYDLSRGAIAVTRGVRTVYLIPYSNTAWIDDEQMTINHPVVIIDDITYVPLHFMCYAFGMDCTWNPDQSRAFIAITLAVGGVTRFEFDRDDDWAHHPHVWRHDVDADRYRHYQDRQPRPVEAYPVPSHDHPHGWHPAGSPQIRINPNLHINLNLGGRQNYHRPIGPPAGVYRHPGPGQYSHSQPTGKPAPQQNHHQHDGHDHGHDQSDHGDHHDQGH